MCRATALCLGLLPAAVAAQPVAVNGAWARATAPRQVEGAVYFSLTSVGGDTLLSVASTDAAGAMLHRSTGSGGMAGMADMDALPLPPGRAVTLAPRGMHVMLMGLKHPLVAGGHVDLTLSFAHAPPVELSVPVLPIGSRGPLLPATGQ